MSDFTELEKLQEELLVIKRKIELATEWRKRITKRVIEAIETLRQNPSDENNRKRLVNALNRENQFLDMVRKGTKNAISILKATKSRLNKAKIYPQKKE